MIYLFAYGTLKRNGRANYLLDGGRFLGEATTTPHYRLYSGGWYPMMIAVESGNAIEGELWEIPETIIPALDRYEGGGYKRTPIDLITPFCGIPVITYLFRKDVQGLAEVGLRWDNT